jgi:hypothetical protein
VSGIKPGKRAEAESIVQSVFQEFYPVDAFYFEPFENNIYNENATRIWGVLRNVSITFAGFSILISSVGLFGRVPGLSIKSCLAPINTDYS